MIKTDKCRPAIPLYDYYPMIHFIGLSHIKTVSSWSWDAHLHNDYEWLFVDKGLVRSWINDYCFTAKAGDFYFIQPGQKHKEIGISPSSSYYALDFHLVNQDRQPFLFFPLSDNPSRQRLCNDGNYWRTFYREIFQETLNQKPGWKEIVEAKILLKVWRLRRQFNIASDYSGKENEYNHQRQVINKAKLYIQANCHRHIPIKELANYCCISYFHIEHIFKRITGMSPVQYILLQRIIKARRLLAEQDYPIKSIAEQVGFNDVGYFSKQFKRMTGCPPGVFRKRNWQRTIAQS